MGLANSPRGLANFCSAAALSCTGSGTPCCCCCWWFSVFTALRAATHLRQDAGSPSGFSSFKLSCLSAGARLNPIAEAPEPRSRRALAWLHWRWRGCPWPFPADRERLHRLSEISGRPTDAAICWDHSPSHGQLSQVGSSSFSPRPIALGRCRRVHRFRRSADIKTLMDWKRARLVADPEPSGQTRREIHLAFAARLYCLRYSSAIISTRTTSAFCCCLWSCSLRGNDADKIDALVDHRPGRVAYLAAATLARLAGEHAYALVSIPLIALLAVGVNGCDSPMRERKSA